MFSRIFKKNNLPKITSNLYTTFRSFDYLPYNKLNPTEDTLSSLSNDELLALLSHEEKLAAEEKNEKTLQRKRIRFQDRRDEATSRSDSRHYEDRIYRHHNSIIGKRHASKKCVRFTLNNEYVLAGFGVFLLFL